MSIPDMTLPLYRVGAKATTFVRVINYQVDLDIVFRRVVWFTGLRGKNYALRRHRNVMAYARAECNPHIFFFFDKYNPHITDSECRIFLGAADRIVFDICGFPINCASHYSNVASSYRISLSARMVFTLEIQMFYLWDVICLFI